MTTGQGGAGLHAAALAGVARLLREASTAGSDDALVRACLRVAEEVTESRFGFLGEVDPALTRLEIAAISDPGRDACRTSASGPGTPAAMSVPTRGLYGRALRDARLLVANDPASLPDRIATPPGHPPLTAFLAVPLILAGETLGLLGLANRPGGYGPEELAAAELLAPAIAQALWTRRARRDLLQREDQLRLVIQHTPAAVAIFDRQMRYLAVSERFAVDLRTETRDLLGRSHYEVFPEIPERWRQIHRRCLAGATERCEEDPFPRADGTLDWVRWEITPWRTATGEIGGIILFSEVITERKRAELALVERERDLERRSRELQAVLDTVPAAIYISRDARGAQIEGNRYGQDLLRAKPGENLSRTAPVAAPYRVLRHGLEVPAEELPVQLASARGQDVRDWDCTIAFEDGTTLELLGAATPLTLDGGGAVAAFVDITARRRAEDALRRSEAWYRAIFESTQAALLVLEAVRDGTGAVRDFACRDANAAALRLVALDRAAALGRRGAELVLASADRLDAWRAVLERGEPFSYEATSGRAAFLVTVFRMDGNTLGVASVDLSRTLHRLMPVCAWCGKIKNEVGSFEPLERYIREHTDAQFTHGLCPSCADLHFGDPPG